MLTEASSESFLLSESVNPNIDFICLFQEQVKNHPDETAVIADDGHLTYRELDIKSGNFSKNLKLAGVKSEDLIGLCTPLCCNFLICMLGIIKAGATYFPLDPTYPRERLEYMLQDGNPSVLIVDQQFSHLFGHEKTLVIEEALFSGNSEIADDHIPLPLNTLAYVIFTSGSTGLPKGIMVTHRSLLNIAHSHRMYYPSHINMLVSGGVCFDASLLVIFHALINNSPLYLFNHSPNDSNDKLLKFIIRNSIEYLISVPSQYQRLLEVGMSLFCLKCVSLTGENLPDSLCELHSKLAPNAVLYNEYGPSECAIGSTIARIYDPKSRVINKVTVGRPLPNTQVYILDEDLNPLPNGSQGEICIGGQGLARGYLNKDDLTAEKFIPVAFSETERLYRTGDLGKFLPNGELEFLGRMDQQIQILGNRVNLGEIEYHLSRCNYIKEFAVIAKNNLQGVMELVAYISSTKRNSTQKSLIAYLKNLLPPYMIPSRFIQINEFPFTPNGKIDRDALEHLYG